MEEISIYENLRQVDYSTHEEEASMRTVSLV